MAWNVPSLFVTGSTLAASQLNQIRDSLKALGDPWTPFTPVWTATGTAPALGNGVLTGGYLLTGKRVEFWMQLQCGSTTTYGTGNWKFAPPVTLVNRMWLLNGIVWRQGTGAPYAAQAWYQTSGFVPLVDPSVSAGAIERNISGTVPHTWQNQDYLFLQGVAEAA